jgi:hypothetical protein
VDARVRLVQADVASELATAGSVMAKQERMLPSSSGTSHSSRCAGEAYRASTSMLPVSGDVQLVHCDANSACIDVPMISHTSAYWRFVSAPDPNGWL